MGFLISELWACRVRASGGSTALILKLRFHNFGFRAAGTSAPDSSL